MKNVIYVLVLLIGKTLSAQNSLSLSSSLGLNLSQSIISKVPTWKPILLGQGKIALHINRENGFSSGLQLAWQRRNLIVEQRKTLDIWERMHATGSEYRFSLFATLTREKKYFDINPYFGMGFVYYSQLAQNFSVAFKQNISSVSQSTQFIQNLELRRRYNMCFEIGSFLIMPNRAENRLCAITNVSLRYYPLNVFETNTYINFDKQIIPYNTRINLIELDVSIGLLVNRN